MQIKNKIKWRIYYGDGTTFDNNMGSPHDAPAYNVQCVVTIDPGMHNEDIIKDTGKLVIHNWQYYLYRCDIGWFGCFTDFDLLDHFVAYAPLITAVTKARTIPHKDYVDIFRRALNDPDFPNKSAWIDNVEAPHQNGRLRTDGNDND